MTQPVGLSDIFNKLSTYRWGAHHPDCSFHDHHVIRIMNHPFCLGCVSMYSGIVLGVLILFIMYSLNFNWLTIWLIGLGFIPLPYLQMHYQIKWFKIFARVGLGIGSVLFIGGPLFFTAVDTKGNTIRVLVIAVYIILVRHALSRRQKTMNRPCDTCTEGVFPICSWNKDLIIEASKNGDLDEEGREFMEMVAQSLTVPQNERMVLALSASDFD